MPTPRAELLADFRPDDQAGYAFDLILRALEPVTLAVEGMDAFAGQALYLADPEQGRLYDLRLHPTLTLAPATGEARYQLLVGDEEFVQAAQQEILPEQIVLYPNYPNPFNPSTVIEYAVPEAAQVRLVVYDVLGRRVRLLAEGPHERGFYHLSWDGTDESSGRVASGTYLLRLRAGGRSQVRRMLLLK